MVDIKFGDMSKIKMRMFARLAQKELAKQYPVLKQKGISVADIIHEDLRNATNYSIRKIYKKLMESAKIMNEPHQTRVIADIGSWVLWVISKDTAYRDPFFWIVNELKDDKKFWESIQEYVKPPEEWYCPTWHKTKEITAKEEKEGKITRFQMSKEEKTFVPSLQQKEWKKIQEDVQKETEKEMKKRNL